MQVRVLDILADPTAWVAVASGEARLDIAVADGPRGPKLRLDFDFRGGGGFVVARRALHLTLPVSYAFSLDLQGPAPANTFEFKLADPTNANVWRYCERDCAFPPEGRRLELRARQFEYAWGPAGGGTPRELGAIEFAIVAPPGGAGTLWIGALALIDRTPSAPPRFSASGQLPDYPPEALADPAARTPWRPAAGARRAWVAVDFGGPRDYGGLALRWDGAARGCALKVSAGEDGTAWRTLYETPAVAGAESLIYLPHGESRWLRLDLEAADGAGEGDLAPRSAPQPTPLPGLAAFEVLTEDASRTLSDWFHTVAARAPRGRYPRWLAREQTYWTPVDLPDGALAALINEDGLIETAPGGCGIEPFLAVDGCLVTWADVAPAQRLEGDELPLPAVVWDGGDFALTTRLCAGGTPESRRFLIGYRVENRAPTARTLVLYVAVRPYPVTPPWQVHRGVGGAVPVRSLAFRDGVFRVDGSPVLVPLTPPDGAGVATFDQGAITEWLARGVLPDAWAVEDRFGYASGALRFDLPLAAGARAEVRLAAPADSADLPAAVPEGLSGPAEFARAATQWAAVLGAVRFDLPAPARAAAQACKTAIAHILVNRDGPALQPGPRRYTRSWIRDGAVMGAALNRFGRPAEAAEFIRWYAAFQRADGFVPCCVDREGPDWLAEHDSHGELIFAVADCYRFTGDLVLARDLWPAVCRAVGCLERLRAERLTETYRGERAACRGLLPESVSHEGYLAQPVHAYWDDFWALRGFKDAADLAAALGEGAEAARLAALADDFRADLLRSLAATMAARGIDFLPGSVEWADPDPTALANALTLIDEAAALPAGALRVSFDAFMRRFRAMHSGAEPWVNYTPYEIRIIGALIRLGRRAEAHQLLDFHLAERRPPAWNQWPEIAWADPRSPGHQGDLPHAWIGAEYALAFRDCFAYERGADRALVIGAGIPDHWLDAGPVAVNGLPTAYGRLDLRLARTADGGLTLDLGGDLRAPPGGILLAPPGTTREYPVTGATFAVPAAAA